jgi:hypothetical protein
MFKGIKKDLEKVLNQREKYFYLINILVSQRCDRKGMFRLFSSVNMLASSSVKHTPLIEPSPIAFNSAQHLLNVVSPKPTFFTCCCWQELVTKVLTASEI